MLVAKIANLFYVIYSFITEKYEYLFVKKTDEFSIIEYVNSLIESIDNGIINLDQFECNDGSDKNFVQTVDLNSIGIYCDSTGYFLIQIEYTKDSTMSGKLHKCICFLNDVIPSQLVNILTITIFEKATQIEHINNIKEIIKGFSNSKRYFHVLLITRRTFTNVLQNKDERKFLKLFHNLEIIHEETNAFYKQSYFLLPNNYKKLFYYLKRDFLNIPFEKSAYNVIQVDSLMELKH